MKHRSRPTLRAGLLAAVVTLTSVGVLAAPATSTPAGAAGPSPTRDGQTSQTAGTSCWAIKQSVPASADGVYWLWTPKLVGPQRFYCDMTTDGGGWVLVGRGREGWTFPYWGQDSPSNLRNTITGTAAFAPATLPTPTMDGLLNGGRVDALTDGIRLRRAADQSGSTWQEVRMRVANTGSWSWALGGGLPLSGVSFDNESATFAPGNYQTNTTANVQIANDTRRVNTVPQANHDRQGGFAYGATVAGENSPTSYLWTFTNENNAIPFTQMFLRPRITEADVVAAGVTHIADSGIPASTVRKMLDRNPTSQPWAVTGINMGTAVSNLATYVRSFAQIGNTLYMGGKFLQVQHGVGGPTYTQSYLAAFDVNTGEWIPSFNPVIDAPVFKIMASPDGTKLFVGGEFTNVNGVANTTALAALDPTTGAPVGAGTWSAYASRPTGSYDVRAMSISGQWLYLGGNFTRITGGTGADVVGPLTLARLARVRLSDGRPDWNWQPTLETAPSDLWANAGGDRVYVVGAFSVLNGVTLNPNHQAVIDTTTGAAVPGLTPWVPTKPGVTEPSNTIMEYGDHVYQGGSQHYLHSYSKSDYTLERARITQNAGGDFQAMAVKDGILYASCHCVTDWQYEDTVSFPAPQGYSRVDPINLIGAYDTTANLEVVPEFHPTKLRLRGSGGEGPWSLFVDSTGCMWAGGDLLRTGASSTAYYGGYERFCDRDTQAPATPVNVKTTVSGTDVTLTWNPTTDNSSDPIQYEVLRDDPTLGTIVEGTTFDRTWTDTDVTSDQRYFVRALDATGNRSATTAVVPFVYDVTPPVTTDDTSVIGTGWKNSPQTVTLTPTDVGTGVAATYYTTNGTTPTTASAKGTSVTLSAAGTYTIKYFSVDQRGNTEAVRTATNPVRIDLTAPTTTDNSAAIGTGWKTTAQTVTLTSTDTGGAGTAATYFTTDGSTPTTASAQGTTVTLSTTGVYTIRYFSVDGAGNTEAVRTAATTIRIDRQAPVTTDDSAAIGSGWKATAQTVTLTPSDTGAGVAATHFTTDGSTPTAASPQGTNVLLTGSGAYTVRYFSVDAAGNPESVRTASTVVRIDRQVPNAAVTFPANGGRYQGTRWAAGCAAGAGICGTASDAGAGIGGVRVTVQRTGDGAFWDGGAWVAASTQLTPTGTTAWNVPLDASSLTDGVTYTVTVTAIDQAGNATTTTGTFTYDTTAPATTWAVVKDHSGVVQAGDTFTLKLSEALDPASVPTSSALTLRRSATGNTQWRITGLTNGQLSTGSTGYLARPPTGTTYKVTYNGTVSLASNRRTITFTVTGACSGSCTQLSTTPKAAAWSFAPSPTLLDAAGNAAIGTLTGPTEAMF